MVLGPGLLQESPRLGTRLFDVRPVAGELLQFLPGRGERRAGEHDAADRAHDRDLRQRRRAVPAVDRQGQRAAHARVVERLSLVVRGGDQRAIPIALLHRDLVAQGADQFVAGCGRHAAKLDRGAVGADCVEPGRLLWRKDPDDGVEIRQPRVVVVRVALAPDRLAGLVADQLEGAGAHDVLLVPARIAVEDFLLVDPGVGVGERRDEGAGREFEAKHDSVRVGCLDRVDHDVEGLPCAGDAGRRADDLAPAGGDVGGGQRRAVMPFDAVADLEGVGLAAIGRGRHLGAEIADEIGRRGRVVRVDPDQDAVVRRRRVHRGVGGLAVAIEAGRRVGGDEVGQGAAAFWRLPGTGRRGKRQHNGKAGRKAQHSHRFLPFIVFFCIVAERARSGEPPIR